MSEYQIEGLVARMCAIIRAVAMCAAAIVPIALLAAAKHAPPHRGEDSTLIESVLKSDGARAPIIAWVGIRR